MSMSLMAIASAALLQSNYTHLHSLKKRIFGAAFFFVPVIMVSFNPQAGLAGGQSGFYFIGDFDVAIAAFLSSAGIVLLNYFTAGHQENLKTYPQIRAHIWTPALVTKSCLAWMVYLILYEAVFRGLFFFTCVEVMGLTTAMICNAVVCSLAHLLKSRREAFWCIPFSLFLCAITWASGSIWYAAAIHIVLALSHEFFSIHANPAMRFELFNTKTRRL